MATLRAVLLFPVRPAAASDVVGRTRAPAMFALVPPLALFLYLVARGCSAVDGAVTALGVLLLVVGAGTGGAVAGAAFRRLAPGAPRRGLAVSLVFAAWACIFFAVALVIGRVAGIGALTPLASGLALLVWGVVTATRVVAGESDVDPGRSLVAACGAASGAVIGLLLAGYLVHAQLVMSMPAPTAIARGNPGDPLLVRRGGATRPGDILVARDAGRNRLFLARVDPNGRLVPFAGTNDIAKESSRVLGRVFYRFGGPWGGESLR